MSDSISAKPSYSGITEITMREKPNIILIMSDEHDPGVTGCYGHGEIRTPNIDALADQGIVFDCAYTNNPICVPSRMSFMTGRHSHRINVWDNDSMLSAAYPTMGSYL